jgi:hypothetical protein
MAMKAGKAPRRTTRGGRFRVLWLYEVGLILVGYWLYSAVRNGVAGTEGEAVARARDIVDIERQLGIYTEQGINAVVAANEWLAVLFNYYYATLHFGVTISVGVWVYVRHRRYARRLRNAWYAMNVLALIGFASYALAPPRLLPGGGYVDTIVFFRTWGSWADPSVAEHSNQYAAMPSMHIGWALWVAVIVVVLARRWWVRALGWLYPVATLLVIVGTGNHYWLDAVGGAVACAGGFAVQRLLSGKGAFSSDPPSAGPPAPPAATSSPTPAAPPESEPPAVPTPRGAARTPARP